MFADNPTSGLHRHRIHLGHQHRRVRSRRKHPDRPRPTRRASSRCGTVKSSAVTTDNVILAGLADQNPGEFEVVGKPFTAEPYGIGLAKGDDAFREFINDTLEAAYEDGRWADAWEATAGAVLALPEPPAVDRY